MVTACTLDKEQPRSTRRSQRRIFSAVLAVSAVFVGAFASSAAAQTVYVTQSPGIPQGVPQMPMPGGRQPPNAAADLPPGTATLPGHVYASDNGQPLRKAQV